jgi:hypothetical protein
VILRVLNLFVIGGLVLAAVYVYRIKLEATVQAERLAKLRDEVRQERDKIAALRAEWGELDEPARIQALAQRFLKLGPIVPTQFDSLARLPAEPPDFMRPGSKDPIGGMIEHFVESPTITGSISAAPGELPGAERTVPAVPARSPPATMTRGARR